LKILLLGGHGQLGSELQRVLAGAELSAPRMDITHHDLLRAVLRDTRPRVIVNAAAYTAVDQAESEPQRAAAVNAEAPAVLGEEAGRLGALLVHYSTDYVFDGRKRTPYLEADPTAPLSVYGRTKLEGERAVLRSGCRHLILRTAWLYSRDKGFVGAILRRASAGARLSVVNDQVGAPTAAADLARLTVDLLRSKEPAVGLFHAAAAGEASWHEVAVEILRLRGLRNEVAPVTTAQYGARAARPAYSVLDSGLLARSAAAAPIGDWRERLAACLAG
jgi:dTDP-4-dehydrorhamnose reductase